MKLGQLFILLLVVSLFSCNNEKGIAIQSKNETTDNVKEVNNKNYGIVELTTDLSIDEVSNKIEKAIESNPKMTLFATMDYNGNSTLLFGNPHVGTPIIKSNGKTALDLPLKVSVFKKDGKTNIAYNSTDYLINRYNILRDENLNNIDNWFNQNISILSNEKSYENADAINLMEGIVEIKSPYNYSVTKQKISDEIRKLSGADIIEVIDHGENAADINQTLNPSTLYLFDIKMDCQELIDISPSIAVDLPTKILVYQNSDDTVMVAYNHPYYLAKRHNISNTEPVLERINKALGNITTAAIK